MTWLVCVTTKGPPSSRKLKIVAFYAKAITIDAIHCVCWRALTLLLTKGWVVASIIPNGGKRRTRTNNLRRVKALR